MKKFLLKLLDMFSFNINFNKVVYKYDKTPEEVLRSDWEAIDSDWNKVGEDLRKVFDSLNPGIVNVIAGLSNETRKELLEYLEDQKDILYKKLEITPVQIIYCNSWCICFNCQKDFIDVINLLKNNNK